MPMSHRTPWAPQRWAFATLAAILMLFVFATPARAVCTAAPATVNLGTASSFSVAASSQQVVSSTGFSCSGSGVLTLITTNTVTATIQSATNSLGTQPRLRSAATGDHIPYVLCRDASCNQTFPVGTQITWSSTTLLGLLNLFSGPGGTLPIYVRTLPGTQVAAGTYQSTVTLSWNWNICSIGALNLCLTRDTGTASSTIQISLIVTPDCEIAAPSVNFGSEALVSSFDAVTQSLSIRCSKGAAYTVGVDNGIHALNGVRRLSNGANFIEYDVYYPAASNSRWGRTAPERRSSSEATLNPGSYTGIIAQGYTYRAAVNPNQPTPPGGTYTDTLTIDVQF